MAQKSIDQVETLGLGNREELEAISAAWRAWSRHPDAFVTRIHCEAIGWKP